MRFDDRDTDGIDVASFSFNKTCKITKKILTVFVSYLTAGGRSIPGCSVCLVQDADDTVCLSPAP